MYKDLYNYIHFMQITFNTLIFFFFRFFAVTTESYDKQNKIVKTVSLSFNKVCMFKSIISEVTSFMTRDRKLKTENEF